MLSASVALTAGVPVLVSNDLELTGKTVVVAALSLLRRFRLVPRAANVDSPTFAVAPNDPEPLDDASMAGLDRNV